MRAALHLSVTRNGLSEADAERVLDLLKHFDLPLALPEDIETATILEKLASDKKFSEGAIRFVLLDALGDAAVHDSITHKDLEDAIEHLRSAC